MPRRLVLAIVLIAVAATVGFLVWRRDHRPDYLTGVVEGEERVIRAEVSGRVLTVEFAEGDMVPPNATIATLDDRDIVARLEAKLQSLNVTDAEIARQEEQVATSDRTWQQDVKAHQAELRNADSASELAEATYKREQTLIGTGASTQQLLDETRAARDQSLSARDRARDMLARTQAEEGMVAVARHQLEVLRQQRELSERELAELRVTHDKSVIRSPAVPTRVETQFLWPGEFAQPGTPVLALLDPRDQYVQIYIPVAEMQRVHLGQRVAIELDSAPGMRVPGEISFIADRANFTPEKIETREDRIGQVYRAKVKILQDVERFKPGTEGNIYLEASPPG